MSSTRLPSPSLTRSARVLPAGLPPSEQFDASDAPAGYDGGEGGDDVAMNVAASPACSPRKTFSPKAKSPGKIHAQQPMALPSLLPPERKKIDGGAGQWVRVHRFVLIGVALGAVVALLVMATLIGWSLDKSSAAKDDANGGERGQANGKPMTPASASSVHSTTVLATSTQSRLGSILAPILNLLPKRTTPGGNGEQGAGGGGSGNGGGNGNGNGSGGGDDDDEEEEEENGLPVGIGPKCTDPPFSDPDNFLPNPCNHCKFFAPVVRPAVAPWCFIDGDGAKHYGVTMREVEQFSGLLDRNGNRIMTKVWAYGVNCSESWSHSLPRYRALARASGRRVTVNSRARVEAAGALHSWPGPNFEAYSNEPVYVLWKNELPFDHIFIDELDATRVQLHCGLFAPNCSSDVRTTIHFHGGHVLPQWDGHANSWFTQHTPVDFRHVDRVRRDGDTGSMFFGREFYYQLDQEAATLWYHDHTMGITRLNVYAGLNGMFLLRDARERELQLSGALPSGRFNESDGRLDYNRFGEHEIYANYSVVNGRVWPYMDVEPTRYRFRMLNGCNTRPLILSLQVDRHREWESDCDRHALGNDRSPNSSRHDYQHRKRVPFTVVFTDGGLISRPSTQEELIIVPAERYDIVVDFSPHAGRNVTMHNAAPAEFGAPWECPTFCPPSFNTGIDRFIRFRVADKIKRRRHGRKGGEHGVQQEQEQNAATPTAEVAPPATTAPPATATTSTGRPIPPNSCPVRPPHHPGDPVRSRCDSFFDAPTTTAGNPLPDQLRPFFQLGAPDRVRQVTLVETPWDVLQHGHAPEHSIVVNVNDHGEHDGHDLGPGVAHDALYLLSVNDNRFHHGLPYHEENTELLEACTTDRWEIINLTNDTHAIHLHLMEFELIGRANFSSFVWGRDPVLIEDTIQGALPHERGPKDTFRIDPGMVLYIQGFFDRPGRFVWHCHMLDHEDLEMMHDLEVIPGHCSCITSPLLREEVVVPARNLPPPFTLRERPDSREEEWFREDATRTNAETMAAGANAMVQPNADHHVQEGDVLHIGPHGHVHVQPQAEADGEAAMDGDDGASDLDALLAASDSEGGDDDSDADASIQGRRPRVCPVRPSLPSFPESLRSLPRGPASPLVNALTVESDLTVRRRLRRQSDSTNGLHATICPGAGGRATFENTVQAETLEPEQRMRLAVQEVRTFQFVRNTGRHQGNGVVTRNGTVIPAPALADALTPPIGPPLASRGGGGGDSSFDHVSPPVKHVHHHGDGGPVIA